VWKIFGAKQDDALEMSRGGASRAAVLGATGCTVGVRDVSFSVRRGETFVVMGLSGSGKSTLVRCLSRLVEPTAGEVLVDGEDLLAMSPNQLREVRRTRMSMVFQHFGLFPHKRVIDNVAYGLEVQRVPKAKRREQAYEVLKKVGLSDWAFHFPQQLSGGMQQRVGLARALALDPEILFFDEPFSALDPLIRRDMQDELMRLQREDQRTIVFITHDFAEAIRLRDRIAIMKDGEFDQIGTPDQLVLAPATDYVREFVTDVPREHVLTAAAVAHGPVSGSGRTVDQHAKVSDVLPMLLQADVPVDVIGADGTPVGSIDRQHVAELLGARR
jgi:glycine betaine/proline transport system ATP-binding protein